MRAILFPLVFIGLFIFSCKKDDNTDVEIGKGIEIYLTEIPYSLELYKDYSKVDFDTVLLYTTPMLRYNDIKQYDTITNKLTLGVSHKSLKIEDAGAHGRMFVVTVDKSPIYCGFKWPALSSVFCTWVCIYEPVPEIDNLKDNEIIISFSTDLYADPRLDKRIVSRLKADGKIK